MKLYTDIKQSKRLSEILPLNSADLLYYCNKENPALISEKPFVRTFEETNSLFSYIPCWSLNELMTILWINYDLYPLFENDNNWRICMCSRKAGSDKVNYLNDTATTNKDLLDCCVELIEKLYKLKLL